MKVGDTVKLKPAMWQGIKPESYGLSFIGEYVVSTYFDNHTHPSIKLEDIHGLWDAQAFQVIVKEREKEVNKFKVGDKVISVVNTPQQPEGFIGLVDMITTGAYPLLVRKEYSEETLLFAEHELALLKENVDKSSSALDKQISGDHYKSCGIQPIEYIHANGLDYFEGNAVKYITRHRKKNGKADIEKAIHYLELLLELEYKDEPNQETKSN